MSAPVLRDYQVAMMQRVNVAMRDARRVILESPTGSGKTLVGSYMSLGAVNKQRRVLWLTHRIELIHQTSKTFASLGLQHGYMAAGLPFGLHHAAYIGSIGSVLTRMEKVPKFDLVICDEAHRSISKTWQEVIDRASPRWVIGLSATPIRLDGRGLCENFDAIVHGEPVASLIEQGYLSPFKIFAPSVIDVSGVKIVAGEYNSKQLAEVASAPKITGDAIEHYHRLASGKSAVVFCTSIEHARGVAFAFLQSGVTACSVDGDMSKSERDEIIASFRRRDTMVLTSCDLISEGLDIPGIEVAISLRPTQSLALWLQQIGRCIRFVEGKTAIILDHAGNTERHGFPDEVREWTLDAKVKKKAKPKPLRTCPMCFAIFTPRAVCSECGHVFEVVGRELMHVDGELVEAQRRIPPAEKERFYGELLGYAQKYGKSPKMPAAAYLSRFGHWPPRKHGVAAIDPSAETIEYLRKQARDYARKMAMSG